MSPRLSPTDCKGWWTLPLELSVTLEHFDRGLKTIGLLHDQLHCLDAPEKTEYKLGVTVYRCLHGRAPRYLAQVGCWDHLIPASDVAPRRRRLRTANLNCLTVPRCRLNTYGCRAFYYAGPTVWNSLPDKLSVGQRWLDSFKRFLKTINLLCSVATSVTSALEVSSSSNKMRCINQRITYFIYSTIISPKCQCAAE